MPESFLSSLASHGVLGIVCAILLWTLWQKDKDLTAERAARIADAQNYTKMALDLQGKVLDAVQKIGSIFDELRKRAP